MSPLVVIIAAFIGVAALVGGLALFLRGEESTQAEDRLDVLTGAVSPADAKGKKAKEASLLLQPLDAKKTLAEILFSPFGNFRRLLAQADTPMSPSTFLLICGALGGAGALLCLFTIIPIYLAPVIGIACALLPLMWLVFRRKRRLAAFSRQLPDALELVGRALRAGHSLAAGINLVGTEMEDPIRKEFARCYDEQNFGIPLDEALEEMTERVPNLDLRFFATSVILQRQTGGDLAEILDKIGYLIRERFKIWGQIQALTGEGRLSGIVLLALPPVLFVAMWRLNPEYTMILFNDPLGHKMLGIAAVMQIFGALVIRKIVNIKV